VKDVVVETRPFNALFLNKVELFRGVVMLAAFKTAQADRGFARLPTI